MQQIVQNVLNGAYLCSWVHLESSSNSTSLTLFLSPSALPFSFFRPPPCFALSRAWFVSYLCPVPAHRSFDLCTPPSSLLNQIPVVNRKNADLVLKSKEENKAVADVYMARSRGKPLLPRPNLDQRKAEKLARIEQQGKVNELLEQVFAMSTCCNLQPA